MPYTLWKACPGQEDLLKADDTQMAKNIQTKREREKTMLTVVRHVLETKKKKGRLKKYNEA